MKNYDFLLNLGFTLNEAKVYVTLLEYNVLNGYEIAKFSTVSRSLVYEVLTRLVNKGFVIKMEGEPSFYKALDYTSLIKKMREDSEKDFLIAEEQLKNISVKKYNNDFVLNIVGVEKCIEKAKELINSAQGEISLSIWDKPFNLLKSELEEAIKRNVKVYIFSFGKIELNGATIFSYNLKDSEKLFPYYRSTLIVDGGECLVGESNRTNPIYMNTRNHSIVSLATDELVLNIFWQKYIKKMGLLSEDATAEQFLNIILKLKDELGISDNMTKNFLVYNFQKVRFDHEK